MNVKSGVIMALGAVSLALAGCSKIGPISQPAAKSGTADFSRYVAMGTSVSAGFESGGLVVHHQTHGFAYLFAQQAGTPNFTIPSVSADGIPPLLQVVSLSPLIISNVGRTVGAPTNFAQPYAYSDMGIPGAFLIDASDSSNYDVAGGGAGIHPDITMFNIIQRNRGNITDQVASLNPTFVSFEYGGNDALGPASLGGTIPPNDPTVFAFLLDQTLTEIQTKCPNAKLAIFTCPDVTSLPYFTTFPPVVLGPDGNPVLIGGAPIPLIGTEGGAPATGAPLGLSDLVLLSAGDSLAIGTGFPVGTFSYLTGAPGNGRPLPNSMVLSSLETIATSATIDAYNTAIATEASTRGFALVDLHALLEQGATTGFSYQGSIYTSAYVTGGLFSLDGVHPTDLSYGIICNAMIDAVDRTFGSSIPHVSLAQAATSTSSRVRPTNGRKLLPYVQHADQVYAPMFQWQRLRTTQGAQLPTHGLTSSPRLAPSRQAASPRQALSPHPPVSLLKAGSPLRR
jgi:lysophospholipase L1-like esterase